MLNNDQCCFRRYTGFFTPKNIYLYYQQWIKVFQKSSLILTTESMTATLPVHLPSTVLTLSFECVMHNETGQNFTCVCVRATQYKRPRCSREMRIGLRICSEQWFCIHNKIKCCWDTFAILYKLICDGINK